MVNPATECDQESNAPPAEENKVTQKFIVAVHGIGDQTMFGTVKSAAYRFFSYRGAPANIPLGSFHVEKLDDPAALSLDVPIEFPEATALEQAQKIADPLSLDVPIKSPKATALEQAQRIADPLLLDLPIKSPKATLRFAEVYWAPFPREMVKEGYTLEESKRWAQTVVERFRARYERDQQEKGSTPKEAPLSKEDFSKIKQILLEMIESIHILERLTLLAQKAGLFTFNLGKLLDDYVGDVQIVADFQGPRSKILDSFLNTMRTVTDTYPDAEIYIVAHSEGTVVSFLGLLKAMTKGGPDAAWVKKVRGYMTIGSPLDKHLLLWPELFGAFGLPNDKKEAAKLKKLRIEPEESIQWKNYYDFGDPIGFNLRKIRDWLSENEWNSAFKFEEGDDCKFSRYPLPGKAHTDYWQDKDVFGHFIQTVVKVPPQALPGKNARDFSTPPKTRPWAQMASYGLPYLLVALLCFAAIFILRKGVLECISPEGDPAIAPRVLRSVGLSALALSGLTVMAGTLRLTRKRKWLIFGPGLFLLLTIPYWWYHWPASQAQHFVDSAIAWGAGKAISDNIRSMTVVIFLILAVLLVLFANWVIKRHPSWGLKPLLVLIGAPVAALITYIVQIAPNRESLWPLLLAGAGAMYLWWLSALLFDLVFIWHYYIRHEAAINNLREPALSNSQEPVTERVT